MQAESSFVGGGGCRTGDLTVTGVWTPLPGGFPGDFNKPAGEFCMGVFTAAVLWMGALTAGEIVDCPLTASVLVAIGDLAPFRDFGGYNKIISSIIS